MACRIQRTNAGRAAQVARWLARHRAELRVDDRLPDAPPRYLLVPDGGPLDDARGRFRTVEQFGMAIETPGGVAWT